MSYYYERIQQLISQHSNKKPLQDFYTQQAIQRLNTIKNPKRQSFLLLEDLKKHLQKHSNDTLLVVDTFDNTSRSSNTDHKKASEDSKIIFGEQITSALLKKLFFYKSLHIRAIILDTIDSDYASDIQTFYKPEKWIEEVIDIIEQTFVDSETKKSFCRYLGDVIVSTFVSKNSKLGYNGNQLLINMIYLDRYSDYELGQCISEIEGHFVEGRLMSRKELELIIDEYKRSHK